MFILKNYILSNLLPNSLFSYSTHLLSYTSYTSSCSKIFRNSFTNLLYIILIIRILYYTLIISYTEYRIAIVCDHGKHIAAPYDFSL